MVLNVISNMRVDGFHWIHMPSFHKGIKGFNILLSILIPWTTFNFTDSHTFLSFTNLIIKYLILPIKLLLPSPSLAEYEVLIKIPCSSHSLTLDLLCDIGYHLAVLPLKEGNCSWRRSFGYWAYTQCLCAMSECFKVICTYHKQLTYLKNTGLGVNRTGVYWWICSK